MGAEMAPSLEDLAKKGHAHVSHAEAKFWAHVESSCASIPDALAWLSAASGERGVGGDDKQEAGGPRNKIGWESFFLAVKSSLGIDEEGEARQLFYSISLQSSESFGAPSPSPRHAQYQHHD